MPIHHLHPQPPPHRVDAAPVRHKVRDCPGCGGTCQHPKVKLRDGLGLWRRNRVTGYWVRERDVTPETQAQWLEIFKRDAPGEQFKISATKPRDGQQPDTSHLVAIHARLDREKARFRAATNEKERKFRAVQVSQAEKELAAEMRFLGMKSSPLPNMSNEELLRELGEPPRRCTTRTRSSRPVTRRRGQPGARCGFGSARC